MKQQNTTMRVRSDMAGFEYSFSCLPSNQAIPVRKEIMAELGWSIANFYYKKGGNSPIWEHELPVLEEIFRRFKIDVHTGSPITK